MSQGDFLGAAKIYARLEQSIPGNHRIIANYGMALHMAGRHREAITKLEAALTGGQLEAPIPFMIGRSYLALNLPSDALKPLRQAVNSEPEMSEARQALAHALGLLGRHWEAAEALRSWAAADSGNPAAWYDLAASYTGLAQIALDALEKEAPESAYMIALVAEIELEQERYNSAFALYREALARRPRIEGAHLGLARIYSRTGHPEWAAVERAREEELGGHECLRRPAACSFQQGKFLESVEHARSLSGPESHYWMSRACAALSREALQRLNKLPPSVQSFEASARAHRERQRHGEAINAWRSAIKLRPGDPRLEKELAVSLHMNRDFEAALPILERLVAANPESAELNYSLGHVLVNLRRPAPAVERLEAVARREPSFLPARASLGLAYLQLDEVERAIPHLEAALPSDTDGSLQFSLSQAYRRAGESEKARQAIERYQQIQRALADRTASEERTQITAP